MSSMGTGYRDSYTATETNPGLSPGDLSSVQSVQETHRPEMTAASKDHKGAIIGSVLGSVVLLFLLILVIFFVRRRRQAQEAARTACKYQRDAIVASRPETLPAYSDGDYGYGWNEKAVDGKS
ncbi:hypothetical protein PM082_018492 [Marasmius tenuissimus]|nr:hypothetical protein PM082_018492 [Marasmius tenuissimus]